MDLLGRQQLAHARDVLHVLELGEALRVVERFHEHTRELLLLLGILVLLLAVLKQNVDLGDQEGLGVLGLELFRELEVGGVLLAGRHDATLSNRGGHLGITTEKPLE